jgi:hypothetical protein
MQTLSTFPSKGSKSIFNLEKLREKVYKKNLYLTPK